VLGISDEVADDQLRAKAKARLEALLDSDDEGKRLAAARALYSYGPAKPPGEPDWTPPEPTRRARGYTVTELLQFAAERGGGILESLLSDLTPEARAAIAAAAVGTPAHRRG
jgi:hypothetical protein